MLSDATEPTYTTTPLTFNGVSASAVKYNSWDEYSVFSQSILVTGPSDGSNVNVIVANTLSLFFAVALTSTVPSFKAVTIPRFTVATSASLTVHTTDWLASVGSTVAVTLILSPALHVVTLFSVVNVILSGLTSSAFASSIIKANVCLTFSSCFADAMISTLPLATAVTKPDSETVAILASLEFQITSWFAFSG